MTGATDVVPNKPSLFAHLWPLAILVPLGVIAAVVVTQLQTPRYNSSIDIGMPAAVTDLSLERAVIQELAPQADLEPSDIEVAVDEGLGIVTITAQKESPQGAADAAAALADSYIDSRDDVGARVLDEPSFEGTPASPNRLVNVLVGGAAGLVAAGLAMLLSHRRRHRSAQFESAPETVSRTPSLGGSMPLVPASLPGVQAQKPSSSADPSAGILAGEDHQSGDPSLRDMSPSAAPKLGAAEPADQSFSEQVKFAAGIDTFETSITDTIAVASSPSEQSAVPASVFEAEVSSPVASQVPPSPATAAASSTLRVGEDRVDEDRADEDRADEDRADEDRVEEAVTIGESTMAAVTESEPTDEFDETEAQPTATADPDTGAASPLDPATDYTDTDLTDTDLTDTDRPAAWPTREDSPQTGPVAASSSLAPRRSWAPTTWRVVSDLGPEEPNRDPALAGRVADLESQIEILESEISRYRDAHEALMLAHASEIANRRLRADQAIDTDRRRHRDELDGLRKIQREALLAQKDEFDAAWTKVQSAQIAELDAEQQKYNRELELERRRRDEEIATARARIEAEAAEQILAAQVPDPDHEAERSELIEQLNTTKVEAEGVATQLAHIRSVLADRQRELERLRRSTTATATAHELQIAQLQESLESAHRRIADERRRSAATVSEVMGRSAELSGHADRVAAEANQRIVDAETVRREKEQTGQARLEQLLADTDERSRAFATREAELEGIIAELRARTSR